MDTLQIYTLLTHIYPINADTIKCSILRFLVFDRFPLVLKRRVLRSSALVLTLMFLFLSCVTPICFYNINVNHNINVGLVVYMVYWIQYAVNFLVYTVSSANFRKAYRRFFELCKATSPLPNGSSSSINTIGLSPIYDTPSYCHTSLSSVTENYLKVDGSEQPSRY